MTQLTKQQACALLHISSTTLWRRIKAGTYTSTRTGEGQFASLSFTYADIGLPEPKQTPEPQPTAQPFVRSPDKTPEPTPSRPESKDIRTWAEKYKDGDATDSTGNKIDGTNARFSELTTYLGPVEIDHTPVDTQAHMDERLCGTHDTLGNPIVMTPALTAGFTRSGEPLAHGLSQDAYDAMMNDWRRSGGGRSEAEQEIASRRAVSNIRRSFPR